MVEIRKEGREEGEGAADSLLAQMTGSGATRWRRCMIVKRGEPRQLSFAVNNSSPREASLPLTLEYRNISAWPERFLL